MWGGTRNTEFLRAPEGILEVRHTWKLTLGNTPLFQLSHPAYGVASADSRRSIFVCWVEVWASRQTDVQWVLGEGEIF